MSVRTLRSTYVPSMTDRMLNLTDPNAYFNDIPVDFGPVLFDVMNQVQSSVGTMQFLIGLSMRHPDQLDNVIELAKDSVSKLGDSLDGMLLGNVGSESLYRKCRISDIRDFQEPDLYAGHDERDEYSIDMYVS
jgi:hypothetical protein